MLWNKTIKTKHARSRARFESDLTDEEWILVEPWLPPPAKRGRLARPAFAKFGDGNAISQSKHRRVHRSLPRLGRQADL